MSSEFFPKLTEVQKKWLEFAYLCVLFGLGTGVLGAIQFKWWGITVDVHNKVYVFSFIGGMLGGWAFDTKWFYRVIAGGKDGQYKWNWESCKLFWRFFIPHISALVALVSYIAATTDLVPLIKIKQNCPSSAFAASFIIGYFSDAFIGVIADKIGIKKTSKETGDVAAH